MKDTINYTQKGVETEQLLAELLGLERFLMPRGVVNTAAKGAAGTYSCIVSKMVLLCNALEKPSIHLRLEWALRAARFGSRVKKFRMENLESEVIEEETAFDAKQIAADLGIYAANVIA